MIALFIFLFSTDLLLAENPAPTSIKFSFHDINGPVTEFDDTAFLSGVDDNDIFCKENANVIFPDPLAYNIYHRCHRNRRETWKCIGGLHFDVKIQRCSNFLLAEVKKSETSDVCHQQEDGYYPLYNTNCKRYVRCKGGITVHEKQCLSNELFSYGRQSCQKISEVTCVQSFCALNSDGKFVLPGTKCKGYYICRKGKRFDFLCPRNQVFNIHTKICEEGGICYEPICTGRRNGAYPDTTHNCDRYFKCWGGVLLEVVNCPKSLKHNGFACVPHESVRCEKPEKTAITIYIPINDECKQLPDGSHVIPGTDCTKVRICENGRTIGKSECPINYRFNGNQCYRKDLTECDKSCAGKPDGYYADEMKECREYYFCYHGRIKERKECEIGTSFDGNFCSPSHLVNCVKKSKDRLCEGLQDGFHPDYFTGCRKYMYCHNQQVIIKNICPESMRWNGSHCVNSEEFKCDSPKPILQCEGAVTGLYQHISSSCTQYLYCKNGKGVLLACPMGKVYDGSTCKRSNEYTCPNAIQDECYKQPDGYRQDENSNCRSYFFCSKGFKITYICANNFVFNGTHCVSPNQYNCPFHTNDCDGKYNGYYPDGTTGCKKYFYCLNERRITTLNCGGSKVFNGEACVQVNEAKNTCAQALRNQCYRRKDGRYSDLWFHCEKYIECKDQELSAEKVCPQGSAFDGTSCSYNYTCSSKDKKFTCDGYKMGFITDFKSGCKNYYFCIGNNKLLASCPEGTIFNGRVCQDVRTYACPHESV